MKRGQRDEESHLEAASVSRREPPTLSNQGAAVAEGGASLQQRPDMASAKEDASQRRKITKKPSSDMPRRPLSAYNLFFLDERVRWLSERESAGTQGPKESRRGGVRLPEMARAIAKRWRELSADQRQKYEKLADTERDRYRVEIDAYNRVRQEHKRLRQAGRVESERYRVEMDAYNRVRQEHKRLRQAGRVESDLLPLQVEHGIPFSETDAKQEKVPLRLGHATVVRRVGRTLVFLGAVTVWYFTNSMHGITMHSFAQQTLKMTTNFASANAMEDAVEQGTASSFATVQMSALLTTLQLLAGSSMGMFLGKSNDKTSHAGAPDGSTRMPSFVVLVAILHALGSWATNLGFLLDHSSVAGKGVVLVQVVKLLEPLETLFWTRLLTPLLERRENVAIETRRQSDVFSTALVCSLVWTVANTMWLLVQTTASTNVPMRNNGSIQWAVMSLALVSGLLLTSRNVLQRTFVDGSSSSSWQRFAQLSWQSGLCMAVVTLFLAGWDLLFPSYGHEETRLSWCVATIQHLKVPQHATVLLWHPLYNGASLFCLDLCQSALTHSLWNAGKRVVSILAAVLWFQVPLSSWQNWSVALIHVLLGLVWFAYAKRKVHS